MFLKQIKISNYQSHKKSVIPLHPGVNVFIGATDAGKSAIFRALGWPITNRNGDKGYRSRWGGTTDVELEFEDGKIISRVHDEKPGYFLYDPKNNVDEEYRAFKTDIPEDIITALNMDELNIQSQFDPPFLLADSGGDVAKLLNKVANLTDIDKSISYIRKEVLANSREITTTEAQITDLEKQSDSFQYLEQMEKDVESLEGLEAQYNNTSREDTQLAELLVLIYKAQVELEEIELFLKAEPKLEAALTLTEELKTVTGEIRVVEILLTNIEKDRKAAEEIELFLKAESDLEKALQLVEELKEVQKEGGALQEIIKQVTGNQTLFDSGVVCLKQLEADLKRSFPSVCPLCERSMK